MSDNPNNQNDSKVSLENIIDSQVNVAIYQNSPKETKDSVSKFIPSDFPTRVNYFTGRQNVLGNIDKALQTFGNASLADTHGVGKTSVLVEYAYLHQANYANIIFIRATNNEFDTQISKALESLEISLPVDTKPEQRLTVFQDWLAKNNNWLLLVDNVDDVAFIQSCNFNKPNGKIFYTSNDAQIYKVGTKVELPKMLAKNAMLLLYKHWRENPNATFADIPEKYQEALKGIAEKFGNHPFSMAFVGSYLSAEDESLDEFLAEYQNKEKNLLAKYSFITNYQHKELATAFLLRFEQISAPKDDSEREQFLAVAVQDYLKLSAFIAPDNIPEELLQQSLALLHEDHKKWTEDNDFIKDIYKRFKPTSIFKRDAENKTLSTHRIVQEIMRTQIKEEEDIILEVFTEVLAINFKDFDFTNKEIVERYLLHVEVFLEYLEQNKTNEQVSLKLENKSIAGLCNRFARYFEQYGQYEKAEKYYKLFKDMCESIKNIDQNLLATSYNNLAGLYETLKKYKLAEKYYFKDLKISIEKIGKNHPDTATTYSNLGVFYNLQNNYELAEKYSLIALNIREEILEKNHPDIARSYNNLAAIYFNNGKLYLAKKYHQKSLKILLINFGENHPRIALSYFWYGKFCQKEKKYQEALNNCYKAMEIYLRFLPKEHPEVQRLQKFIDDCERLIKESES